PQLRKNVEGKRRARDGRFWLDDVQQNDFASELFGKSQRVVKRVFRHVRKINRHENFFEIQNPRDHFGHAVCFGNLRFHLPEFSMLCRWTARQQLLNRVHFLCWDLSEHTTIDPAAWRYVRNSWNARSLSLTERLTQTLKE